MFAKQLPESLIKGMSIRARELGAVNLGQGIPSFPTAPHILSAARDALSDPTIGVYPNFLGELALRQAIADRLMREHPQHAFDTGRVLVTVGAMEGTAAAILAVAEAGDTVAVITPDYCNHEPQILLAKARVRQIPMKTDASRWQLDRAAIEKAFADGVKMIIYTSPGNPTGVVFTAEDISFLVELAKKHDAWILSDETYDFLTYDRPFVSLLSMAGDYEKALVVRSFSKEYAMTGWRVGYVVAHADALKVLAKTHDALTGCVPKISQRAAIEAINGDQDAVTEHKREYATRRERAIQLLSSVPGVTLLPPEGAYYAFAKYSADISSTELAKRLLEEAKVAVIPGSAFGTGGEGYFRISYGVEEPVLVEGVQRIREFFSKNFSA